MGKISRTLNPFNSITRRTANKQIVNNIIDNFKPELSKIAITKDRIRHMHGVAEFMYKMYDMMDCKELSKEECYLLGFIHDIGRLNSECRGHEIAGAELLNFLIDSNRNLFVKCIRYHGSTPDDLTADGYAIEEIPAELVLLWWADMSVQSNGEHAGEVITMRERLNDIKERFGDRSTQYRACEKRINFVARYIASMTEELMIAESIGNKAQ